jgi:8-hydroxy-5-deazaflavin:NADPH oxidoreductase
MNITLIGSGNMGSGLAKQFARAGHQVGILSRDRDKAEQLARQTGSRVLADPAAGAAAEVVVVATHYGDAIAALRSLGSLAGKIIVDITNPLTADYMGLTLGYSTSAAEEIAKAFPEAAVVKAFNTVFAQILQEGPDFGNGQVVPVFYAGDVEAAKSKVRELIESTGFTPMDAGPLKNARYLEPLAGLNIYLGYGAGLGTGIAPAWIHKAA